MDALLFSTVVSELHDKLCGAKIVRVDQTPRGELWISMRKPGENLVLQISAANPPRVHLTAGKREPQGYPPNFCMLLRKRLEGARIVDVTCPQLERIARIDVSGRDELGISRVFTLVAEIMGNRSNIMLLDSESVITGILRPVSSSKNRYRELLPGIDYVPPPPVNKVHPRDISIDALQVLSNRGSREAITTAVSGLGPVLAREACCRASVDEDAPISSDSSARLVEAIRGIWSESVDASLPRVYSRGGTPIEVHVVRLSHLQGADVREFASVSGALDYYYSLATAAMRISTERQSLMQKVTAQEQRVTRRLLAREAELLESLKRDDLKRHGDLILTYLPEVTSAIRKRDPFATLPDVSTGEPVRISLDLSLDAPGNAQRYYKTYARQRSREKALAPQVEKDRAEALYLQSVVNAINMASSTDDLVEITRELEGQGLVAPPAKGGHLQQREERVSSILRYALSDGSVVMVGKNNRQNDQLTMKVAMPGDIWLHAKGIPGAHVLLRAPDEKPPSERALEVAACLAAYYSSARTSTKVEVDYTLARYVRKPSGAKPGMVIYDHQKTINSRPELPGGESSDTPR